MNNNIEEVLDEAGIMYQTLNVKKEDDQNEDVNTYFINLSINNELIYGGIVEGHADKHVTIIFFSSVIHLENKLGHLKILEIINNFNKACRYGNFVYDDGDITYSLSVPVISGEKISKSVFEYYFSRCLSTVKEAFGELQNES